MPGSAIRLLDAAGKAVAETTVDDAGKAALSMPEDSTRAGLWALEFDKFSAVIELDELTRWEKVKGGEDKKAASFKSFVRNDKPLNAIRFSKRNLRRDGGFVNIPLYLVPRYERCLRACEVREVNKQKAR